MKTLDHDYSLKEITYDTGARRVISSSVRCNAGFCCPKQWLGSSWRQNFRCNQDVNMRKKDDTDLYTVVMPSPFPNAMKETETRIEV